jgi:hypothetical protein
VISSRGMYESPSLECAADPSQSLLTYTAEPGSPSQYALKLLASWPAGPRRPTTSSSQCLPAGYRRSPPAPPPHLDAVLHPLSTTSFSRLLSLMIDE